MSKSNNSLRVLQLTVVGLISALLVACGSTKVVTAEKTIVYNGSLYTMARVESVSGKLEATTPDGDSIDVMPLDKSDVRDLLKRHGSVTLRSAIMLDERELLYEQQAVDSYRGFSRIKGNLESALTRVQKFMADAKKTQLKL
jgi:hypothetical protein